MLRRKLIVTTAVIALLGSAGLAMAETPAHAGHGATELALTLNAGNKWKGDDNMINGMNAIRASLVPNIGAIHANSLSAAEYKAIAAAVQAQVDFMVANCKLTPEVDEQFHTVLGQVLEGVYGMETGTEPQAGAVRIVSALNSYGDYFEHPGWQPLE